MPQSKPEPARASRAARDPNEPAAARDPLTARIDLELRLVADAIELVASGASERVTIGGLRFGDQLVDRARAQTDRTDLRVRALYGTDESGSDVVVERAR